MTPRALPAITERAWMAQVRELAGLYGWRTYHPWLSVHSQPGWPDLALVKAPRLILAELKSDKGRLTVHQKEWIEVLGQCDEIEAVVWRPEDLETVNRLLRRPPR
jgi:hypothetical protein